MPSWWTQLGPAGPIIGALLSAGIGALVVYTFTHKRMSVSFLTVKTEDLVYNLKRQHIPFSITVEDHIVSGINRAEIAIRNLGNASISDFEFDVIVPGERRFVYLQPYKSDDMAQALVVGDVVHTDSDSRRRVSLPFFNPKETLGLAVLFDGEEAACEIYCRMREVKVQVERLSISAYPFASRRGRLALFRVASLPTWGRVLLTSAFRYMLP